MSIPLQAPFDLSKESGFTVGGMPGYTHILAFHELSTTAAVMSELIANLKARGYRFVTLSEYMQLVGQNPSRRVQQEAVTTRPPCHQEKVG